MNPRQPVNPKLSGNLLKWILIGGAVVLFLLIFLPSSPGAPVLEISQVVQMAEEGRLAKIQVRGDKLDITTIDGEDFRSRKEDTVSVLELLAERGVQTGLGGIQIEVKSEGIGFGSVLLGFLPVIIIGGLIFWMIRRSSRGGIGQATSMGKSQAQMVVDRPSVRFDDVAGADEAKQELAEIVELELN